MSTPDRLGRNCPNPSAALTKLWDVSGPKPIIVELAATDARDALQRSPTIFLWALPGETAPPIDVAQPEQESAA
ncbi:hypothetical protein ABIB99_001904 [Bradyrhizobium sp. LA6.1]|uniref:hypothetical protein n=1 Tax=Bradyrhizobium sp. LA6.1 TaxID=3156378 RepID=UPI00339B0BEE